MQQVYSAQSVIMAAVVKNMLENAGIDCVLRNEYLGSGMGELPPIETWPEVWVIKDHQAEHARQLVSEMMTSADDAGPAWACQSCGETVDAHFDICWNCQTPRAAGG